MQKRALILSGIHWDTTVQRHHAIARHLAEHGYEVHFVEGIISSAFSVKKLLSKVSSRFNKKSMTSRVPRDDRIKLIHSPLVNPQGGMFGILNKAYIKSLLATIDSKYDVIINYLPVSTTRDIIDSVEYKTLIYDCVRDFSNWGGYPKDLPKIEHDLIIRSTAVLVDSYYLYDKLMKQYPDVNIFQILPMLKEGQADVLAKGVPPKIIKNISYIGQISDHIDVSTLRALSGHDGLTLHHFGDSTLRLHLDIVDHGFISDPRKLARDILKYSDAIIIPYKGNMDGVIPAKLFECLATSLPVFVSDFYDSRKLGDMLYVYSTNRQLLKAVHAYTQAEQIVRNSKSKAYLNKHDAEHEIRVLDAIIARKERGRG